MTKPKARGSPAQAAKRRRSDWNGPRRRPEVTIEVTTRARPGELSELRNGSTKPSDVHVSHVYEFATRRSGVRDASAPSASMRHYAHGRGKQPCLALAPVVLGRLIARHPAPRLYHDSPQSSRASRAARPRRALRCGTTTAPRDDRAGRQSHWDRSSKLAGVGRCIQPSRATCEASRAAGSSVRPRATARATRAHTRASKASIVSSCTSSGMGRLSCRVSRIVSAADA